jgi:hypothetical protein
MRELVGVIDARIRQLEEQGESAEPPAVEPKAEAEPAVEEEAPAEEPAAEAEPEQAEEEAAPEPERESQEGEEQ